MKISNSAAVPVYTISGSSTARPLPEWLARKRKRSLKNDPEYANRIELLQDFEFEGASNCIRISEDGDWVMSTGTYKPQIHVHNLPQLSLSFARHTTAECKKFELLSTDYSKSIHLQEDRSLELHTAGGCHHTTRLPRYGRDLKLDRKSAEALVPASGLNENGLGEVFRLNLELGRYMRPYEVDVGSDNLDLPGAGALQGTVEVGSVNVAAVAEQSHNLQAFGTSIGSVEFWDPRSRRRAGAVAAFGQVDFIEGQQSVTALDFDRSGLNIAVGSSGGFIHLYDLRSSKPFMKRDQGYGNAIHNLMYIEPSQSAQSRCAEPKLLSADERMIKIWDRNSEGPWTSIEPAVKLNDVAWYKDSGMILTANEGRQQHAFFVPQLGPAPPWCAFLDNLVEEMTEDPNDPNAFTQQKAGEVYDNYKFLTMEQLDALSLSHLVGTTSLLRPYMHGFFVPQKLYEEAKVIADPYMWEEQRAKRVRERIEKERDSRIRGNKKVTTKVNRALAEKLVAQEEKRQRQEARRALKQAADQSASGRAENGEMNGAGVVDGVDDDDDDDDDKDEAGRSEEKSVGGLMSDPRFSRLFADESFAIDEESFEYKALNPNKRSSTRPESGRALTAVEQEELDEVPRSSDDETSSSAEEAEEDEDQGRAKRQEGSSGRISTASYRKPQRRQEQLHQKRLDPEMRVRSSTRPMTDRSFGSRKIVNRPEKVRSAAVMGEREVTFVPSSKKAKRQADGVATGERRQRKTDRRSASGNTFRRM